MTQATEVEKLKKYNKLFIIKKQRHLHINYLYKYFKYHIKFTIKYRLYINLIFSKKNVYA